MIKPQKYLKNFSNQGFFLDEVDKLMPDLITFECLEDKV